MSGATGLHGLRRSIAFAGIGIALLLCAPAWGAGDRERGRAKAEPCAACHGRDGNSEMDKTPSLAGQPEVFLTLQLIMMREKIRDVPVMQPFVQPLSDEDIADLAAYFAGLEMRAAPTPRDDALYARGRELSGRLRCGTCHGPDFAGREQMPRLAGQREDYLLHSMREFRDNRRAGTDTTMAGVLYGLSDADLEALAHYTARGP